LAIFGAQRTGKTYLASILSQELHRRGVPIYAINLAMFGEEDFAYWGHCKKYVLGDISEMCRYDANQLIEQAIDVVEEFYAQKKAILIIDEWAYAGGKNNAHAEALEPLLKLVADKLSILTSTGIKRGRAIWTIAPEFVAKDLQEPALAIKKSKLLYVTIPLGKSVDWNGNKIGFDDQLYRQVKNNYAIEMPEGRFTQDRICYLNKEWIEMGELPALDTSLKSASSTTTVIQDMLNTSNPTSDMVAALTNARSSTLWGFVQDELGIAEIEGEEGIKNLTLKIARMLIEDNLTELQDKFRIHSEHDIRYSYPNYAKKVAETHRMTGNTCCCCLQNESKEAHHTEYLGIEDKPGKNLLPLCSPCHSKELSHNPNHWIRDGVWGSRNTDEWKAKLNAGFELLATKQKP
jgi:hypothetical protein